MAVVLERSDLVVAYREASGISYLAEVDAARKSLTQASLLAKGLHFARTRSSTIDYDWREENRRKGLGIRWLDRLTREQPSQVLSVMLSKGIIVDRLLTIH